ncbi:MAG: hypothetical protein Q4A16_10135 [Lautropia sp.]|nr:hypothetical protein [Lautropia sp.]
MSKPDVRPWVVLTQDEEGAAAWWPALQRAGMSVHRWPAFRVEPAIEDEEALYRLFPPRSAERICYTCSPLAPSVRPADSSRPLGEQSGIYVLTSPAAVRTLAGWLDARDRRWPLTVRAGVPGQGTARVFRQHFGQRIRLIVPPPPMQDGEHLAAEIIRTLKLTPAGAAPVPTRRDRDMADHGALVDRYSGAAEDVALERAAGATDIPSAPDVGAVHLFNRPDGRTEWLTRLENAGLRTAVHPVYRVFPEPGPPSDFAEALARHRRASVPLNWVLGAVAPLNTVAEWLSTLPEADRQWAFDQPVWLPHPRLLSAATEAGFGRLQVYHDRQQLIERLQWESV